MNRLNKGIKKNITEESEAATGYRNLARTADKAKDKVAAKRIREIASEERHHRMELRGLLKRKKKCS